MGQIPPSEKQIAQINKWSAAAEYYRKVKADPLLSACYTKALQKTGYPLSALTNRDFHRPPTVTSIDLEGYSGKAGQVIDVHAYDDICVVGVSITLRSAAGQVLEFGQANADWGPWRYVTRTAAPLDGAVTVEAVAQDLPGNRTMLSKTWVRDGATMTPSTPAPGNASTVSPVVTDGWDPRAG